APDRDRGERRAPGRGRTEQRRAAPQRDPRATRTRTARAAAASPRGAGSSPSLLPFEVTDGVLEQRQNETIAEGVVGELALHAATDELHLPQRAELVRDSRDREAEHLRQVAH